MHNQYKSSKSYSGDTVSLYNNLLHDSYFTRNVLHLSGIITLGRQSEVEYRLAFRNSLHIAGTKQFNKESVIVDACKEALCVCVCSYDSKTGAVDGVEESTADCSDGARTSSCRGGSSRHRLTRSTSDKARRCAVTCQRFAGDERSAATPWRLGGSERSTLPRANRDAKTTTDAARTFSREARTSNVDSRASSRKARTFTREAWTSNEEAFGGEARTSSRDSRASSGEARTSNRDTKTCNRDARTTSWEAQTSPGDVWRPRNDVDLHAAASQRQRTNSFERAAGGRREPGPSTSKSPSGSVEHHPAVWSGSSSSSPWDLCLSGRQTAGVESSGGAGLNEYGKFEFCSSQQSPAIPGALSRSWFDIDRPTVLPPSPMSSSAVGLDWLRQPAAGERSGTGTITETKTVVCSICSSETLIAEAARSATSQSQVGVVASREPAAAGWRGGGSLPRCYGQRAGDVLGVPGSASSMPRGLSVFAAAAARPAAPAVSTSSPSEHAPGGLLLSTAAAGGDVRPVTCPSPKRSPSNRDDECKLHACFGKITDTISETVHDGGIVAMEDY